MTRCSTAKWRSRKCSSAFSDDGTLLVTAGSSRQLWDPETRTELQTVTEMARAETVALSPDGRTIAMGQECTVQLYRRS
ncbi:MULTISPECIES: hypothetical protein [Streptomyces]|uniref:hypothetical protein n=1 Tax=Streptomyces TaxID=1883 RepID=UPI00123BC9A6|nr:hypothetical protein [Streptomyces venezuelae]